MEWGIVLLVLYESAFVIGIFFLSLLYTIVRGRQQIINLIFGLYFGLLFTYVAPFSYENDISNLWISTIIFLIATVVSTMVVSRLMPEPFREKRFESLGKKLFLAFAATLIVTLFSFQVVPLHEIFNTSSPVRNIFANEATFFWWLIAPFILLYWHK